MITSTSKSLAELVAFCKGHAQDSPSTRLYKASAPLRDDNSWSPMSIITPTRRIADNYSQDTKNWPDPTEPRAAQPPAPRGCTCHNGDKLNCPIHGMEAEYDGLGNDEWANQLPASPVGFALGQPTTWQQNYSRVTPVVTAWGRPYQRGTSGPRKDIPMPSYKPGDPVLHQNDEQAMGTISQSPEMYQDLNGEWHTFVNWDTTTPRKHYFKPNVNDTGDLSGSYERTNYGPGGSWTPAKFLTPVNVPDSPAELPQHPDAWQDNEPGTLRSLSIGERARWLRSNTHGAASQG